MASWTDPPSHVFYAGLSEILVNDSSARLAIVVRNTSDLLGFFECELPPSREQDLSTAAPDLILQRLLDYRNSKNSKFAGVALPRTVSEKCPSLCSKLWKELDAVPFVIARESHPRTQADQGELATFAGWEEKHIDEQADSMVRKCIRSFGAGHAPSTHLDMHGEVVVDMDSRVSFAQETDYRRTVGDHTWSLTHHYAEDLRTRQIKVAFFSVSPHGRPDVCARHALIRLSRCLGLDFAWYVPRPRPQLLGVIRRVQAILHCLEGPTQLLTVDEELSILEWVYKSAKRYWLSEGGPLRPASEGGANIIVIHDAILCTLALLSKQADPRRPVIFENRLHIHRDQGDDPRRPENQTFEFLRSKLRDVDLVVSQEPKALAPTLTPSAKTGYIPVAIEQLDGLNKPLREWDVSYYGRELNTICRNSGAPTIDYPRRRYFLHLTQLLESDGTIRLLQAYQTFSHRCRAKAASTPLPQLLLCHYNSAHPPDSAANYAILQAKIQSLTRDLGPCISLVQLRPPDQLWNTLVSQAIALVQLSDHEGMPEILLGAVQKGSFVIASRQFVHYPFLHESRHTRFLDGDGVEGLAQYLIDLLKGSEDDGPRETTGNQALGDRSTMVGYALNWYFLASKLSKGETIELDGRDIYALAQQSL